MLSAKTKRCVLIELGLNKVIKHYCCSGSAVINNSYNKTNKCADVTKNPSELRHVSMYRDHLHGTAYLR
jgi:hypothetical protein